MNSIAKLRLSRIHFNLKKMSLKEKLLDPSQPVTFFEMVPPAASKPGAVEASLAEAEKVRHRVDAINLPEIHDEDRNQPRSVKFVKRIDPGLLGSRIRRELETEVVVNRCVVRDADPISWFRKTETEHDIHHVVLVGGESSRIQYPGPNVMEAARQVQAAGLTMTLGGISIPSRVHEAERVRRKAAAGLSFFTTQVLFDSNDIVWLLQRLSGVEARIFLSFAPVSHPRDLEFLRWLGADIPADLDRFLLAGSSDTSDSTGAPETETTCFDRSLDLCQRILMDVFDNLPPDPPLIGLNIEHINKRNFTPAVRMLEKLSELYHHLVSVRASLA
jgi:5,10-methylenetetrahydrofolate reductase